MTCLGCRHRDRLVGVLCFECSAAIATQIVPEQIAVLAPERGDSALVDQWGRPHSLGEVTEIGRCVPPAGLTILDVSVSRHHASIARVLDAWIVRDSGSANGTFVNGEAVWERVLAHGDRIDIGRVAFYAAFGIGPVASGPVPAVITCIQPSSIESRRPSLRILEPTGGNGGLVEIANLHAQLTATQLELVEFLSRRMREDGHLPVSVRGFVRSSELVGVLSWDADDPDETHVKQLVRRVRRTLLRCGLGDLIESRHRLGYRLRPTCARV